MQELKLIDFEPTLPMQADECETKFGLQVAQLASRMKVKQTRIAKDCEISRISVNRFFRGRSEIRASDLVNVLKVLGIDLEREIERRLRPSPF